MYRELEGAGTDLTDLLGRRQLVAVTPRAARIATVLSAQGAAPARLTLARFHSADACGATETVTELVFAFPPSGSAGRSTPRSHVPVVALLEEQPFAGGPGSAAPQLSQANALQLVTRVAHAAERRATLVEPMTLDPDRAEDAGEIISMALNRSAPGGGHAQYAVGFRARVISGDNDSALVTGVAVTDTGLTELRWIAGPLRARLENGMIKGLRLSLRGTVPGPGGGSLLLIDEIADVAPRASRSIVVDPATRRVLANEPLALRCP